MPPVDCVAMLDQAEQFGLGLRDLRQEANHIPGVVGHRLATLKEELRCEQR